MNKNTLKLVRKLKAISAITTMLIMGVAYLMFRLHDSGDAVAAQPYIFITGMTQVMLCMISLVTLTLLSYFEKEVKSSTDSGETVVKS